MNPILFAPNATSCDSFGIGVLSDAISCTVEENRNGSYELEMEYPVTGAFYPEIAHRSLIKAKPNYTDDPQPFRVYKISKPLNGKVTINAQHISYDLSGYVNDSFTAQGIQASVASIVNSGTKPANCPFHFSTDMSGTQTMDIPYPVSIRAAMGGIAGSFLDVYGGEWHFDGYNCQLNGSRGTNRGVTILYGKNLTSLKQDENIAGVYTAVMPYYYNADTGDRQILTERLIQVPGTFDFVRILPLDLTTEFTELPTEAQLRARAESYIASNSIGTPAVNLTVGFQWLDGLSDRVDLCDTVSVRFDTLGVTASAKCIRTKWDVLKDRYVEIELGSARNSLAATIARTKEIEAEITKRSSEYRATSERIASTVTGNSGGYIVLNDTNNDGKPDELLIMDSSSKATAVNVIRMNSSGIAFSSTGYNGTYSTAWNINSEFSADFIASGQLKTNLIEIFGDANFHWDDANIEVTDPTNTNRIIRFGKYDGTNYGMGFSIDGGQTWIAGYDFNGITAIGGLGTTGKVSITGDTLMMTDPNGVYLLQLGQASNLRDENGNTVTGIIHEVGTYRTYDRDGTQYASPVRGVNSVTFGQINLPHGAYSVCVGYSNESREIYGIVVGTLNIVKGKDSIAIGRSDTASGDKCIALGYNCRCDEDDSIAIGEQAQAEELHSIAMGYKAWSEGIYSISIGKNSNCWNYSTYSVIIGAESDAISPYNVAIGPYVETGNSDGNGAAAIAIGRYAKATYQFAIALGDHSEASQDASVAIGKTAKATAANAVAIGNNNTTSGAAACSIGAGNTASGIGSMAIGYSSTASGDGSVAIGNTNTVSGGNSAAIGGLNVVSADYSFAACCGNKVNAGCYGSVVFGQGNTSNAPHQLLCGGYTNPTTLHRFVVGRGTSDTSRDNAMTVEYTGNTWIAGTLTQASDGRLKTITGEAPDLSSVRAVKFEWKDKELQDSAEHIGYIAQDVEKIAPYLVKEDASGTKSLDYIAVLCAKVEMLEKRNQDLEQLVATLAERLDALERRSE